MESMIFCCFMIFFCSLLLDMITSQSDTGADDAIRQLGEKLEKLEKKISDVEMDNLQSRLDILKLIGDTDIVLTDTDIRVEDRLQRVEKSDTETWLKVTRLERLAEEKANDLQVQVKEQLDSFLTSRREWEEAVRKNMSMLQEKLRQQVDEAVTSRMDSAHSNLLEKIRILEDHVSRNCCREKLPDLNNDLMKETLALQSNFTRQLSDLDENLGNNTSLMRGLEEKRIHPQSNFDTQFVMVVASSGNNITCHSSHNGRNIEISRVPVEIDQRESVVTKSKDWAFLNLSRFSIYIYGVYRCQLKYQDSSEDIVFPLQRGDSYMFDYRVLVANRGDTVELEVLDFTISSKARWLHNGSRVPAWDGLTKVELRGVLRQHSGVYHCYEAERGRSDGAVMRLVVRGCPKDLFGEDCDRKCPSCYNGGVCEDRKGVCICPPGFTGINCERACGANRFGGDCTKVCPGSNCENYIFCKPDPFGCSCAPGWKGLRCDKECRAGWYGADCKHSCHCDYGPESCDRFTGDCRGGCSPGWTGQTCQIQAVD